mmetsp:Transcript_15158/g.51128  ORF Transcript_15158/g.51128 Transcript_15158/m.51128 type:complete len:236 (+) Transcript_15158:143-850(+)
METKLKAAGRQDLPWRGCTVMINSNSIPVDFEYPAHEDFFKNVQEMLPFQNWCATCDQQLIFEKIMIQSIDMVEDVVLTLKFSAETTDSAGNQKKHAVWLTGASLHVLVVITSEETRKQHAVLVACPRTSIGRASFLELPMIGIDSLGNVDGAPAKMLRDLGIQLQLDMLLDITHLSSEEGRGIFTSPDSRDEFIRILLHSATMPEAEIARMYDECGGSNESSCKVHILPLSDMW